MTGCMGECALLYGGWLFLRRSGLAAAGAARSAAGSMQEK
jgi:hypothetical protein